VEVDELDHAVIVQFSGVARSQLSQHALRRRYTLWTLILS